MAMMIRWMVAIVLCWPLNVSAQDFPPATPAEAGFDAERLERLTDTFDAYAASGRLAGGVILVLRDGKAVVNHAFGHRDVEARDPMRVDALFRIASQTKAVVSVGILMLQEEGRLLLTDPVAKYLPEFETTNITIRHLLMHAAGIGYNVPNTDISGWYFAHRPETMRELVRRMPSQPFAAQPGERFVYGYATDILGVVIEEITGMSLETFLTQRIFGPLKMPDTRFFVPPSERNRLAVVYSATADRGIVRAPDPGGAVGQGHYLDGPRTAQSGGAGLVSTARDYGRFLQMLLNGGELDGARILSPKSVALMTTDHFEGRYGRPGLGFGLGFEVVTDVGARGVPGEVGDYGWGGAYHSHYWVSPEDRLVVVFLTQLIPATGSDAHGKLRTLLYQAMAPPASDYDPDLAARTGADERGMRRYVMAFLMAGPNRPTDPDTARALQAAHMANIQRMADEGSLVVAGPFIGGGDYRGIYIFAVETIEEARALTETDPAVRYGSLRMELKPWYGSAALMELKHLYPKLVKPKEE